jgi:hypothetical protein
MASAILNSAKLGAYLVIALYVAVTLAAIISTQLAVGA